MSLLDTLQERVGLGQRELLARVLSAPHRYKVYEIPKRNGGTRTIAQPARDLKLLQRIIIEAVLSKLPIHDSAAAYRDGRNIRMNAAAHAGSNVILKLDFVSFFPSIKVDDFTRYCRSLDRETAIHLGLASDDDLFIASRVLFWGAGTSQPKCLSIGAPSSPILSNILMRRFDEAVTTIAVRNGVRFTRYADDITLSGERSEPLLTVEAGIRRYLKRYRSPALTFNDEKRGLYTAGQKRMVTGLLVTPTHSVSLGRHRKRTILSLVHSFKLGLLDPQKVAHAQGLVAFALDIEPSFFHSLVRKYGQGVMDELIRFRLPARIQAPAPPDLEG